VVVNCLKDAQNQIQQAPELWKYLTKGQKQIQPRKGMRSRQWSYEAVEAQPYTTK
jgi:hypothetical protein